nr:DUF305 domain-containing protein [Hoyosella altamirensis]
MRSRALVLIVALVLLAGGFAAGFFWPRTEPRAEPAADSAVPHAFGQVEVGFSQDMAIHHLQAVELCNALGDDIDPMLVSLCTQIRTSQTQEIGMMTGWLELLDQPLASSEPMAWMDHDDKHEHAGHGGRDATEPPMPGMASWQEVDALRQSDGTDAEVQFLQLMIRHHQGGIDMAGYAAQHASVPVVQRLATSMIKEQSQETAVMEHLLRARGAEPLPWP